MIAVGSEDEDCVSHFFKDPFVDKTSSHHITPTKEYDCHLNKYSTEINTDDISLSQLTIEEQNPLQISPYFNITPRTMPISPHYVFEEELAANPWAMLIATIFLTKTSGKVARPHMKEFFECYPTPYHVLEDNPSALERFFINIGLRKRALLIWKLTYQFVSARWRRASDLCGVGKYGEEAYRIFCLGHTDLDPGDRYLKLYLNWLHENTEYEEENGTVDSEFVIEDPVIKYYSLS